MTSIPLTAAERKRRSRKLHPDLDKQFRASHPDYRDREQKRQSLRKHAGWHLAPENCEIAFYDGEASQDDGIYDQFAVYSKVGGLDVIHNERGVHLGQVAELIHNHARKVRKRTEKRTYPLGFSTGYDQDQWIAGLNISIEQKMALVRQKGRSYGAVRGPGFQREEVLPVYDLAVYCGKKVTEIRKLVRYYDFARQKLDYIKDEEGKLRHKWTLRLGDCYSLFNRSFLAAIAIFEKNLPDELQTDLELVREGKKLRGRFKEADWTQEKVDQYNAAELRLGVWLSNQVISVCQAMRLSPRNLYSPADMSRSLLVKYGIGAHIKPEWYDKVEFHHSHMMRCIQGSYFGGRIELTALVMTAVFYVYDLTSGYPTAFRQMPCLAHGHYRELTPEEIAAANRGELQPWAIYHMTFEKPGAKWGPFPVRRADNSVHFPRRGSGYYHACEIQAVFDNREKGEKYRISEGVQWVSECEKDHPFEEMVDQTFSERRQRVCNEDASEYILKLCLNALYGLLAQTAGAHRVEDEQGNIVRYKTPKYCNLFGAGFITAWCRSEMYRMLCKSPDAFCVMTDAIYSLTPIPGMWVSDKRKANLGDFVEEMHESAGYIFVQPGVYAAADGKHKNRGFYAPPDFYERLQDALACGDTEIQFTYEQYQDIRRSLNPDGNLKPTRGRFIEATEVLNIGAFALQTKRMPFENMPYTNSDPSVPYKPLYMRTMQDLCAILEEEIIGEVPDG